MREPVTSSPSPAEPGTEGLAALGVDIQAGGFISSRRYSAAEIAALPFSVATPQVRGIAPASAPAEHCLAAEPCIHPIAAQMRDIILGKAADGEPTLEADLEHFSIADIKAHFPAARQAANAQIVRQVSDDPCYETRAQLLTRASKLLAGRLPTEIQLHATLRAHGITNKEIADLWPDLMATTAEMFQRSRKLPQLRVVAS